MKDSEVTDIESMIEQLRAALEDAQEILEELSSSLVDESTEPVNLKMARLRQCLTGSALEVIRGLGVTVHEYGPHVWNRWLFSKSPPPSSWK